MGKWNHTIYNVLKCFIFYYKICLGDLSMLVHIELCILFKKYLFTYLFLFLTVLGLPCLGLTACRGGWDTGFSFFAPPCLISFPAC